MSATIVTALYDIGRGNLSEDNQGHRKFDAYLEWFKSVLRIRCPLVVFIPNSLESFAKTYRDDERTRIICRELSELSTRKYHEKIQENMNLCNRSEIEFNVPEYVEVIFGKFKFLQEVCDTNPFDTEYFFWIDAGYFRKDTTFEHDWADKYKLQCLENKFLIQNISLDAYGSVDAEYLKQNTNEISAWFFGSHSRNIHFTVSNIWNSFYDMLEDGLVNNEQNVLSLIIQKYPDKYLLYPYDGGRNIFQDFSASGRMLINYPQCKYLKVFSVATKEISPENICQYKASAEYYGYDLEILGREESWGGWSYRTQKYIDAIRRTNYPVICITDCTDVLFVGPSEELYEKFSASGECLIIGTESKLAYQGSTDHDERNIERFFQDTSSRFKYPNGGYLIGKRQSLLELLEANKNSTDDQVGYINLCYERKQKIHRDTDTIFCGNVPKYLPNIDLEKDFWKLSASDLRYYNPDTGHKPCVFHFPGNFKTAQKEFFRNTKPVRKDMFELLLEKDTDEAPPQNMQWYILFPVIGISVVIIFFLIILAYMWR